MRAWTPGAQPFQSMPGTSLTSSETTLPARGRVAADIEPSTLSSLSATSPSYSPNFLVLLPPSPGCSPASPNYSPVSPSYSPSPPAHGGPPPSQNHNPKSPRYSPTSPTSSIGTATLTESNDRISAKTGPAAGYGRNQSSGPSG